MHDRIKTVLLYRTLKATSACSYVFYSTQNNVGPICLKKNVYTFLLCNYEHTAKNLQLSFKMHGNIADTDSKRQELIIMVQYIATVRRHGIRIAYFLSTFNLERRLSKLI